MPDDNVSSPPLPVAPRTRPVSEALLNEKWDRAISSFVIRSALGFSFGVIFSVLLFKRRAWPVWFGTGFGAGRAWEEADANFKRGDVLSTDGLRKVRTER
ncbi:Mitochondrial inner membrane organizing system component [Exophiala dermatitidis]|uniref:MICOS complex subunit MIC10 n=1 Tax=Exophiala dermatitidis TaxID=5970 RepID=A0AAN6EZR9_EXODE|nr:Mitochondrial inner membrane organizing system component [Exophiala dermatitidis]KAJ4529542.1 Mitochondrial inner membrane organizing system component [Exophiala dermatitidis]KAJ4543299.1 Mitochondrial inner membrane organizing system component [Exophiala dermatitidis]KAJ4543798.1 Mitochondrial inner membrane organizing system component [Exophiala dermatitidis]KAJ4575263.1 Mitochondrial inner membrane organizing system component [Exophiala dermatitidis]